MMVIMMITHIYAPVEFGDGASASFVFVCVCLCACVFDCVCVLSVCLPVCLSLYV